MDLHAGTVDLGRRLSVTVALVRSDYGGFGQNLGHCSYDQVELTTGNLPWKNVQDMTQVSKRETSRRLRNRSADLIDGSQVGDYKRRCRQSPGLQELFAGCPNEYQQMLT